MVNNNIKNNADASDDEMRRLFVGDNATMLPIVTTNEIQPIDYHHDFMADLIEQEYSMYGDLPTPRWVTNYHRRLDREREQSIQNAITAEDNRVYHEFLREARRNRRAIREIQAGRGGGSIAELTEYQDNLLRRIGQMRLNPRVSGRRAREFRRYIRDQN